MSPADEPLTFFSSQATTAEDGSIVVAFFDGGLNRVALMRGSKVAILNLIIVLAGCLISGNGSQDANGG